MFMFIIRSSSNVTFVVAILTTKTENAAICGFSVFFSSPNCCCNFVFFLLFWATQIAYDVHDDADCDNFSQNLQRPIT